MDNLITNDRFTYYLINDFFEILEYLRILFSNNFYVINLFVLFLITQ